MLAHAPFSAVLTAALILQSPGQEASKAPAASPEATLPRVAFAVSSKDVVPFLGGSPGLMIAGACQEDGTMFVRMRSDPVTPVSISANGKVVVRFTADKAVGVPNPRSGAFFSDGRSVYVLVSGAEDVRDVKATGRSSDGTKTQDLVVRVPKAAHKYIVRYNPDGSYASKVQLDLPFHVIHIAAFPNGGFLASGLDGADKEPRIALVKWNGQFDRYIALEDDIDERPAADRNSSFAARYGLDSVDVGIRSSQLLPADGSVLLRRGHDARVFQISPSGNVRAVDLQLPSGSAIDSLVPAGRNWVGAVTRRRTGGMGVQFSFYVFDPLTGAAIKELTFPEPMGFGLACATESELTFLRQDREGHVWMWKARRNIGGPEMPASPALNPN